MYVALARTPAAREGGTAPSVRESSVLFVFSPASSSFRSVDCCVHGHMDGSWVSRLVDAPPGFSFLSEYCRALRLLSGLSGLGCIRARRAALVRRHDEEFRAHILSEGPVREFLGFLNEFSSQELPVVFEIIRQHLFPDAPTRCLFRASQLDPRRSPSDALRAASTDLRELELSFGSSVSLPGGWSVTSPKVFFPWMCHRF